MEVLTVTQLARKIRSLLEFQLGDVWVEGEISNHRKQSSGHQYFTLKDSGAQIACVFFRGNARFCSVEIRGGEKVRVFGELSLFEQRGQLQLVVRQVKPLGAGNLHERFEALKEKLKTEGLFAPELKRPIPRFPWSIAIISSPTGAALQDLLSVLGRRAPWVRVFLVPVRVQGAGAYRELIAALRYIACPQPDGTKPDTIILARGGGSLEDLWNFNEEELAREIARCPIPIISAVGHETDFSIADFVADLRAPTPSAAAELAVPDGVQLRALLTRQGLRIEQKVQERFTYWRERLDWIERRSVLREPTRTVDTFAQRLDDLKDRLDGAAQRQVNLRQDQLTHLTSALRYRSPREHVMRKEERVKQLAKRLHTAHEQSFQQRLDQLKAIQAHLRVLGPEAVLDRGYAIVETPKGLPITEAKAINKGDHLRLRLRDGRVDVDAR